MKKITEQEFEKLNTLNKTLSEMLDKYLESKYEQDRLKLIIKELKQLSIEYFQIIQENQIKKEEFLKQIQEKYKANTLDEFTGEIQ